jgi:hypothetical protein
MSCCNPAVHSIPANHMAPDHHHPLHMFSLTFLPFRYDKYSKYDKYDSKYDGYKVCGHRRDLCLALGYSHSLDTLG